MAELKFEAPLAQFDGDEWNDFNDFQTAVDLENCNKDDNSTINMTSHVGVDNFNETFSGSLEDLVSSFDDKINKCFKNHKENVEKLAPVQIRSQEEIMNDCQMWWTITGNFGNILPIDWSKSYTRQLQEKSLNLSENQGDDSPDLDLSDDDELRQAFDLHSMIVPCLHDEPMFTADEVINEIDSMMDEGSDSMDDSTPCESDIVSSASSELLHFRERHTLPGSTFEEITDPKTKKKEHVKGPVDKEGLKSLNVSSLNELLEELEVTIKDFSEILISELTRKDELEYEKELKNQFISLLMSIQHKRKELSSKKKGSNTSLHKRQRSVGGTEPGTYLTSVIPFNAHQGPPLIEQMQIYIKILTAINDDSPAVPGLLTDYILKVLCPTS